MANCVDCVHAEVCEEYGEVFSLIKGGKCSLFKDHSRFVELNIAKKIKHSPDIEKMRGFHKLGLGKGMGERSIFWTCSNCESWVSLAHKYCSNCGAKFEAEQALKERE
jgi:hypothetical protein